jgi:hypothetical protein
MSRRQWIHISNKRLDVMGRHKGVDYHKPVSVATVLHKVINREDIAIEASQDEIRRSRCANARHGCHDWIDITTISDTVGIYFCVTCGVEYQTLTLPFPRRERRTRK